MLVRTSWFVSSPSLLNSPHPSHCSHLPSSAQFTVAGLVPTAARSPVLQINTTAPPPLPSTSNFFYTGAFSVGGPNFLSVLLH